MITEASPEPRDDRTPTDTPDAAPQSAPGAAGYHDGILPSCGYGTAHLRRLDGPDGPQIVVVRADPTIGITSELLANADPAALVVDTLGCILLAGNARYRYRPVRFVREGQALILVCERMVGRIVD